MSIVCKDTGISATSFGMQPSLHWCPWATTSYRKQNSRWFASNSPLSWSFWVVSRIYHFLPLELNGEEDNTDIWIISRLCHAVEQCNRGFHNFDFPMATTACYNFWLYDLCDIYLVHCWMISSACYKCVNMPLSLTIIPCKESRKPVFQGSDAKAISTSRNILYTCLDTGLKLISPFMPFLSEELYQRLPRRSADDAASICIAAYPEPSKVGVICSHVAAWIHVPLINVVSLAQFTWRNEELESEMDLAMNVIRAIRSLRSDYNLNKNNTDGKVVVFHSCAGFDTNILGQIHRDENFPWNSANLTAGGTILANLANLVGKNKCDGGRALSVTSS